MAPPDGTWEERPGEPTEAGSLRAELDRLGDDAHLRERVVERQILHRGHYLTFRIDTIERADGSRGRREIAGHPGAVAVVALDDLDRVLLVRQYRTPAGRSLIEIPAGTLTVDPSSGLTEDPDAAARRELEEETGHRAEHWRRLGAFHTAPGFTEELMTLYLATGLRPAHDGRRGPDDDERLELLRVPWREAAQAAVDGLIGDAKSLAGLLWLSRLKDAGEV